MGNLEYRRQGATHRCAQLGGNAEELQSLVWQFNL